MSGKSSLLEGLTGLLFPVASDLCTRFATQIVLRRAPEGEGQARITIIPGPTSRLNKTLNQNLLAFEKTLAAADFGCQEFEDIFDEIRISFSWHFRTGIDIIIGCYLYRYTGTKGEEFGRCRKKILR